jgi:hypothetical protein
MGGGEAALEEEEDVALVGEEGEAVHDGSDAQVRSALVVDKLKARVPQTPPKFGVQRVIHDEF